MRGAPGFRALLRLYPAGFRAEFGDEMFVVYNDLRCETSAARAWLRFAGDTAVAAPRLLMEEGMTRTIAIAIAVVLFGVAMVGTATGSFLVGAGILAGLGVILLVPSALIARRARKSAEFEYTVRPWPWWTVVASLLAVLYVAFGTTQLARDPKATNVGALCILSVFAAMIAGGLVLRRRGATGGDWMIAVAALPFTSLFWLVWPPFVTAAVMIGAMSEALSTGRVRPGNGRIATHPPLD